MAYFSNFPKINYNGISARNIMLKSAIISEIFSYVDSFYRYTIKDGYRADMVSYEEYKNPNYDWVVYFSNNIVDPYYEWPLTSEDLNRTITKKYGATLYTLMSTVHHYKYTGMTNESPEDIGRRSWVMSPQTYSLLSPEERSGWTPVYTYDYEVNVNDSKRSIRLLDSSYIDQISSELSKIYQ